MSDAPVQTQGGLESQPPLPVRRLHNFIYCPRLFYFQWVENIFQEDADTVAGSHVHRNVDAPSRLDDPKELGLPEGAKLRSLRLESESLGLIGVVDIVEGGLDGAEIIDYKRGSARRDSEGERVAKEPDAMQVAAHALLLREHGLNAVSGAIYYAADKRRVPVELTEELFAKVRTSIEDAKRIARSGTCPPPLKNDARCLYCSAYPICLPNESHWWAKAKKAVATDKQLHFGFSPFAASNEDAVRDRILEALDFAAESGKGAPTLEPPRPGGDDSEVLVVQTPGAQIGQRGEQLIVSVKGEDMRKIPSQQVRAIFCYGAVQITAQAVETCLDLGIDVSYFSPAGRFLGLLRGLPASGVDARRGQYRLFELPGVRLQLAKESIRAKIHNQRVMLMRNGEVPDRVLKLMAGFRDAAASARDLTECSASKAAPPHSTSSNSNRC
ncbi:MAG TPA: CRISPR-associated protein Cas4 [Verrucomicrobiae bacterium]|nr:CRISPR-associated protein Cas4 [Verrucomicrobiae bacterium]